MDLRPIVLTEEQANEARKTMAQAGSTLCTAVNNGASSSSVSMSALMKRGMPALLKWVVEHESEWNRLVLACKAEAAARALNAKESV